MFQGRTVTRGGLYILFPHFESTNSLPSIQRKKRTEDKKCGLLVQDEIKL